MLWSVLVSLGRIWEARFVIFDDSLLVVVELLLLVAVAFVCVCEDNIDEAVVSAVVCDAFDETGGFKTF